MAILKIALIAVTLVTAVACATRNVRSADLELAATKGKRHISPVHYLQPYAGTSLQYHRPSVIVDSGDYYAESDKGNGGYIVFTHEKGKGYKTKGKGGKGKGGGYGYVSDGNGDDGSSESDGHGGYAGKIKIKGKGYYGKGGFYGSKGKGKGSSYGKGYSYGSKGKGKGGSYGKGKGGSYGKGKVGHYGKGKGGHYGKGKGGIPYGSGGYSSYGIGSSDGGGSSSESHGQGISHLYGTVIGTSYGSVGTSYGTVGNSYGISGVSYSSHGSSGGSSSESNGQPDSYGISDGGTENSAGNAGGNESENSGIGENISVGSIKEGNSADSAINADEASAAVEDIGENPPVVALTAGDSANGGSESGSAAVDGGVESGISSSPVSESGNGGVAETGGKKRSTSQTSKKIEEIKSSDSDVNKKAGNPPASSVTITGGSGPSGKTVYNVAIKGGASSTSNENGNNTFRLDFQTDGAGSGEKAFTVSVHFTSGNEKVDTLPDVIPAIVNQEGSRILENKSVNDEITSGGKRSIPSASDKESAKEPEGSAIRTTSSNNSGKSNKTSSTNSSSSGTRSNDDQRATKGEIRSPTTTPPPPPSERNNREKSDTAVDKGADFNIPSPRSESITNNGKTNVSQTVMSSSTGKVERSNKGSENNNDKGRVAKEILSNTGRNSGVLNKGSSGTSETGHNSTRPTTTMRQRPAKRNQTSERVETASADNKDSPVNRTRHNQRTRPPSKPVTNENDSNPLILKSLTDKGNGGRGQRESRDKQPTGVNEQPNAQKSIGKTLPRNNHPIAITTEGHTHLFFNDAPIDGKDKEESPIKLPEVENDQQEKGKRTAVKDVSGDSVVVPPPLAISLPLAPFPYLPVDTYYIPLRRLTTGQKKPAVT